MPEKFCCVQFKAIWPELVDLKKKELKKLEKRGIPRSTFASVYAILDAEITGCPICAQPKENPEPDKVIESHKPEEKQEKPEERPVPKDLQIKCVGCNGTGWHKGKPETKTKCARCKGSSRLTLPIDCPFCRGTGKMGGNPANTANCTRCHGLGLLTVDNVNTQWIIGEAEKLQSAQQKHAQRQKEKGNE